MTNNGYLRELVIRDFFKNAEKFKKQIYLLIAAAAARHH